jgi:quercetin dioxygenase-like cupin family protein
MSGVTATAGSKQRFVVSRANDEDFSEGGLRSFFSYRDLGIRDATSGDFGAHVIRAKHAVDEPQGAHRHDLGFQMVYVLRGEVTFWYDGQGEVMLRAGDSVLQPPGILHEIRGCSGDMELLEITMPADFATEQAPEGV